MNAVRFDAGAVVVDESIYVMGGQVDDESFSDFIEKYDTINNTWTKFGTICTPRAACGLVAFGQWNYAVGGINDRTLDVLDRYDVKSKTWTSCPNMQCALKYFGTVAIPWEPDRTSWAATSASCSFASLPPLYAQSIASSPGFQHTSGSESCYQEGNVKTETSE